jgi:hypothetical protein
MAKTVSTCTRAAARILTPPAAKLRRSDGHLVAVKLPELFADSAFEVITPECGAAR